MDIEAIVKKFSGGFLGIDARSAENILRAALTEADAAMAMEHNLKMLQVEANHAIELRAYETTVQNLEERIRQLEAERVPEVWRPIETAPKDGTHILIKSPTMPPTTVHWFEGDWHLSVNQRGEYSSYIWCGPNLWRPLPSTAAAPVKEGE